jgi:ferric-dicitrate binding protein FerR (iron transport regulator)
MERQENELEALLQKYYDGETSLEEEKRIGQLTSAAGGVTLSTLSPGDQQWFAHLQEAREASPGADLEARTEEKIQAHERVKETGTVRLSGRRWWLSGVAAVLVLGAGISFLLYRFDGANAWIEKTAPPTGQTRFSLPDGSGIWLNRGSTLRYSDQFGQSTREVWLEGEGFFEIAKDQSKPFLVHTRQTVTRVTGTSFNVRSYPDEEKVSVTVLSGQVIFAPDTDAPPEKVYLNPGNEGVFDGATNAVQKNTRSDPNRIAWKTQKLVFTDQPLAEILPVLESYFGKNIGVDSPALLQCRFRGTFTEATLDEVLRVMTFSMNITVQKSAQKITLAGKGCSR